MNIYLRMEQEYKLSIKNLSNLNGLVSGKIFPLLKNNISFVYQKTNDLDQI